MNQTENASAVIRGKSADRGRISGRKKQRNRGGSDRGRGRLRSQCIGIRNDFRGHLLDAPDVRRCPGFREISIWIRPIISGLLLGVAVTMRSAFTRLNSRSRNFQRNCPF